LSHQREIIKILNMCKIPKFGIVIFMLFLLLCLCLIFSFLLPLVVSFVARSFARRYVVDLCSLSLSLSLSRVRDVHSLISFRIFWGLFLTFQLRICASVSMCLFVHHHHHHSILNTQMLHYACFSPAFYYQLLYFIFMLNHTLLLTVAHYHHIFASFLVFILCPLLVTFPM
jgi:hypothetical protein